MGVLQMENDRDFRRIVGKVPTRDKEGNDITGDNLSTGGLRRDDGTISGMAYDLKFPDDDDGTSTGYNYVQHYQRSGK
ncbi:hypothetical protein LDL08_25160 [Nonomuraea glycinis]|uniref:Uncharacterized protein n=1 Tax=Nonomuraea glycinis TaxID=2047744 RepID=A0A918E8T4_9ACTN|nr:hypothetical protein [Nonomuraea glycinis]MCA2179481.1 hypothetical protein [Nonomuraea glycinis]GGP15555.1 hypothetical protein GCM10012278_75890 [Nonomuraea glycinis]